MFGPTAAETGSRGGLQPLRGGNNGAGRPGCHRRLKPLRHHRTLKNATTRRLAPPLATQRGAAPVEVAARRLHQYEIGGLPSVAAGGWHWPTVAHSRGTRRPTGEAMTKKPKKEMVNIPGTPFRAPRAMFDSVQRLKAKARQRTESKRTPTCTSDVDVVSAAARRR